MNRVSTVSIHPSSIVETDEIGDNTSIGPFSHVGQNVHIGKNCVIGQGCHIQDGVHLNDGIHLENGVYIWEGVYLAEDVFVGPQAVFTNYPNPRAFSHPPQTEEILQTKVGRGASIGANSTILCGHIIGAYAVVGAGSTLTHSVRAHEMVYGNPARHQGWVCECGSALFDIRECVECGRNYEMIDTGLRLVER